MCVFVSSSPPVLGVVAGLLWGEGTGQSGHLCPHGVIQVLLTGMDGTRDNERHPEQTGSVLLSGQEVQLSPHLKGDAHTFDVQQRTEDT